MKRYLVAPLLAAVIAALAFAAAGCGGDEGGEAAPAAAEPAAEAESPAGEAAAPSGGVDAAAEMVADGEAAATWQGPTETIDVSALRGKTIWYVNLDQAIPHLNAIGKALVEAAEAAGVNVVEFDGKSNVAEWQRGIEQATAQKADVIVPLAIPLEAIEAPLTAASQAGIPIVASLYTDANAPLPEQFAEIAHSQVTEEYVRAGELEAAWVVADSGGNANVLIFHAPEISVTQYVDEGIERVFAETCPECKLTWKEVPTSEWATQLGTLTRTALTDDPSINYVIPIYDGMVNFVLPAVHQAGAADRVKISSFNATKAVMEALQRRDVVGADIGTAENWEGWAIADASFRAMLGAPGVENYKIPVRLFTANNIDELDLNASEATWYGPVDFKAEFRKLWGVE